MCCVVGCGCVLCVVLLVVVSGEWRMECGVCGAECGEWSVESGVWSVECGVSSKGVKQRVSSKSV